MRVWGYINEGRRNIIQIRKAIKGEEWIIHFIKSLSVKEKKTQRKIPYKDIEELNYIEIQEQLIKQKTGKAPREGEISSEAWKFDEEQRWLIDIIMGVWKGVSFPDNYIKIIVSIHKKGDMKMVQNCRSI